MPTAILKDKVAAVAAFCGKELVLQGARLGDEYFYQSLPLCVIDAVYSIGVKYKGVQNVARRYCEYFGLLEFREPRDQVPPTGEQQPLSALVEKMDALGIEKFTKGIFNNRQRTSPRGGILKPEAIFRFATVLRDNGMNFLQDVPPRVLDAELEGELRQIPGQTSGISITYFFMLAGTENLIKPDRWIGRFLKRCLNAEPTPEEAQFLISGACEMLLTEYPDLTPRLLDNVIWNYERAREQGRISA
jgi:hypothetical protein